MAKSFIGGHSVIYPSHRPPEQFADAHTGDDVGLNRGAYFKQLQKRLEEEQAARRERRRAARARKRESEKGDSAPVKTGDGDEQGQ